MNNMKHRVAVTNPSPGCELCSQGLGEGVDYCESCQTAYSGEVEPRDYADLTLDYFDTAEEAETFLNTLVEG